MPAIDIQNDLEYPIQPARLQDAAALVISQHGSDGSLSIVITDDETIAALNQQYRGIDTPTDVLSFPADEPPVEMLEEAAYLGDLLIAFPYASAQAAREGHPLSDSLALLVVHGSLHLLGYDHDSAENRARMWAAQDNALRALGISLDIVPALESYSDHES